MDEEIERLVISVRADTAAFARDVDTMRGQIDGPVSESLGRIGDVLESSLSRAIRKGSLDFEDLKRVALSVMADIAAAAIRSGMGSLGGGGGGDSGLLSLGASLLTSALGLPGRATGGPVTGGRAYLVGERGPEVFVPGSSGAIQTIGGRGPVNMRLTINVSDNGQGSAPQALQRSASQVARAVRVGLSKA
jgi:phage-related minor tail protein